MQRRLRRDLRLLKIYAVGSTIVFVFLLLTGFRQATPRTKFEEIDVERINVVERDGRLKLVIANSERQTPAMIDGKPLLAGRTRPAGLIFFNDIGDEVGGLIFTGRLANGVPTATGSLTFDQFKQDQTVALQYIDQNGRRRSGLEIIDRPSNSLAVLADLLEKRTAATNADERAAIERQISALGPQSIQRLFVGRDFDGRSTLVLSDTQGRPRMRLGLDADGTPRIQFLNPAGATVREIVP